MVKKLISRYNLGLIITLLDPKLLALFRKMKYKKESPALSPYLKMDMSRTLALSLLPYQITFYNKLKVLPCPSPPLPLLQRHQIMETNLKWYFFLFPLPIIPFSTRQMKKKTKTPIRFGFGNI